ncbi:MAG: protein kinase domain-containing protein [Myxococcota bacterium]
MSSIHQDPVLDTKIGNYHINKPLGQGAFGRVFLGKHPTIDREIALKVLNKDFSSDEVVVHRFVSEAKAVNKINHPNLIQVFDFGSLDDDRFYYIMEYIKGRELSRIIKEDGPMSLGLFDAIIRQIASALEAAHKNGIIHRDLKPANILVVKGEGEPLVKILDFGIAKLQESSEATSLRTKTGQVIGTPAYMAPEQAKGENEQITPRTDIYSLGVIAYQMLTGYLPITSSSVASLLVKILIETPTPIDEVVKGLPDEFQDIFSDCLAKDQKFRPAGGTEFYNRFHQVIDKYNPAIKGIPIKVEDCSTSQTGTSSIETEKTLPSEDSSLNSAEKLSDQSQNNNSDNQVFNTDNSSIFQTKAFKKGRAIFLVVLLMLFSALIVYFYMKSSGTDKSATVKKLKKADKVVGKTAHLQKKQKNPTKSKADKKETPQKDKENKDSGVDAKNSSSNLATALVKKRKFGDFIQISGNNNCFFMGNKDGSTAEKPAHMVCLSAFAVDKYEVTVNKFAKCVQAKKCSVPIRFKAKNNCNYGRDGFEDHPVNCVTWKQATDFCNFAGKELPTEAQWEYAARGKKSNYFYPWGSQEADCSKAVIYSGDKPGCGKGHTWKVGSKPQGKSPFGVHDLAGNVWEWTKDNYKEDYYQKLAGQVVHNPQGSTDGSLKSLRGGAWNTGGIKSTFRVGFSPQKAEPHIGFRCVFTLK